MPAPLTNLYPGVCINDPATSDMGPNTPIFNPRTHTLWYDDFHEYVSGNWTKTATGSTTEALTSFHGGALLLTNSAGGGPDLQSLQHVTTEFAPAAGRKFWMEWRFQSSEATNDYIMLGLAVTDTSPIASLPSDYAVFRKASGGTSWVFETAASSAVLTTISGVKTHAAATTIRLGMYYDGGSLLEVYADGAKVGSTTLPFASLFPTATLRPTIAHSTSTAAAYTLTVDYGLIGMDR